MYSITTIPNSLYNLTISPDEEFLSIILFTISEPSHKMRKVASTILSFILSIFFETMMPPVIKLTDMSSSSWDYLILLVIESNLASQLLWSRRPFGTIDYTQIKTHFKELYNNHIGNNIVSISLWIFTMSKIYISLSAFINALILFNNRFEHELNLENVTIETNLSFYWSTAGLIQFPQRFQM